MTLRAGSRAKLQMILAQSRAAAPRKIAVSGALRLMRATPNVETDTQHSPTVPSRFAPTRWTIVLSAQARGTADSDVALETLCRTYWQPLYGFARRQGFSVADAQDHTQEFFARLLKKDFLQNVAPEKGRFRTFLLVAFKRFLANAREHACAKRRGGGEAALSLDIDAAENLFRSENMADAPADVLFDRQWALTLLDRTLARLEQEYARANKSREFAALKPLLVAREAGGYELVSKALGISTGAARVSAHRLRSRYRDVFRDEIAQTVQNPAQVEDEVAYLVTRLSN